jgi:hypothetical protein
MFGGCAAAQRLFKMIWYVRANEDALPICHLGHSLKFESRMWEFWNASFMPMQREQVCKPNSVLQSQI